MNGTVYDAKTGYPVEACEGGHAEAECYLEVWSCIEKGGFVWLFFGDKDTPMKSRPTIPWVKELNNPGAFAEASRTFHCNAVDTSMH